MVDPALTAAEVLERALEPFAEYITEFDLWTGDAPDDDVMCALHADYLLRASLTVGQFRALRSAAAAARASR